MSDKTDAIRRVEEADLEGLGNLEVEDVYTQIDAQTDERPGPVELFKRWERQQWSASALDFSVDKQHWSIFDPFTKDNLEQFFSGFFVGEQAVTDTLGPIVMGAPDEESRLFLTTQLVDEARHSYFFGRFYSEVLEVPGSLGDTLGHARAWTDTTPFNQIFDHDLVELTDLVRHDPHDYSKWVEAVTLYHLMVEGILALVGQRMILQILRQSQILPAFRSGFTAVTRDESRHVSFAVWALGKAVENGFEKNIRNAVDRSLEHCLRIYANPEYKVFIPDYIPAEARMDPRKNWKFGIESLLKRLRVAGVDGAYLHEVENKGWEIVWSAIDEYESRWGEEHPVRAWERGEIVVSSSNGSPDRSPMLPSRQKGV